MIRRRRPLLRAAVVGGGAYAAGRHMQRKSQEAQYAEDEQNQRLADLEAQQQQGQYQQPPPHPPWRVTPKPSPTGNKLTARGTRLGPPCEPTERICPMTVPSKIDVDAATRETLAGLALSDPELLLAGLEARAEWQETSGLDGRTYSLVKIAALIALDAPPSSYLWQVANALGSGCTPEDLLGVLKAVAPQVGGPRVVAAAPELMVALGLSLPAGVDGDDGE